MDIYGGLLGEIEKHSVGFSLAFIGIFVSSIVFLSAVDALPDASDQWNREHGGAPISAQVQQAPAQTTAPAVVAPTEAPVRIVIDAIGLSANIANPESQNADVLDQALLSGAVRYPTSALLGQNGTVLLFGHSSYLPIVHNQAYKTFDGIQNLKTGDSISVYSSSREYRYRVSGVRTANAQDNDQNSIALKSDAQYLVLVTCDSFGTKSDRFIVSAEFVGTYTRTN